MLCGSYRLRFEKWPRQAHLHPHLLWVHAIEALGAMLYAGVDVGLTGPSTGFGSASTLASS
jgi:hypothetical protein